MHAGNQARTVSELKQSVIKAMPPAPSGPVATLNGFAMAARHTPVAHDTGGHAVTRETLRSDTEPEAAYLDRLCAELSLRGLPSEVMTSSYKPRLRINVPHTYGGFADTEFEDNVLAAAPDGHWSYWWPWIEEICAADDPAKAAAVIITGLGLDASDDDEEDEASAHGDR